AARSAAAGATAVTGAADVPARAARAAAPTPEIGGLGAAAQCHHQHDTVHLLYPPANNTRSQPTRYQWTSGPGADVDTAADRGGPSQRGKGAPLFRESISLTSNVPLGVKASRLSWMVKI